MTITLTPGHFDALIFDCDGTLVDSDSLYLHSLQQTLNGYGMSVDRDWYLARSGLTSAALLSAYAEEISPLPVAPRELLLRSTAYFQANVHLLEEITVVGNLVRLWSGKVPMAVASNGERENVLGSLEATGLLSFFMAVVTIEDVTRGKPAPDIYLEAATRLSVAADRCFVLEDSDQGLEAAESAGMQVLDVRQFTISL